MSMSCPKCDKLMNQGSRNMYDVIFKCDMQYYGGGLAGCNYEETITSKYIPGDKVMLVDDNLGWAFKKYIGVLYSIGTVNFTQGIVTYSLDGVITDNGIAWVDEEQLKLAKID